MLTGKALGAAIEEARRLKGVTKKAMALHFKVAQPSIQSWVNRGTIDKAKLQELWAYFSDVVGPSHWGLSQALPVTQPSAQPSTAAALDTVLTALAALPRDRRHALQADWLALLSAPDSAELRDAVTHALSPSKTDLAKAIGVLRAPARLLPDEGGATPDLKPAPASKPRAAVPRES